MAEANPSGTRVLHNRCRFPAVAFPHPIEIETAPLALTWRAP